jgi:hypothetical protein
MTLKDKLLIIYNTCLNPKNAIIKYSNIYEEYDYGLKCFNLFNIWGLVLLLVYFPYELISLVLAF